MYMDVCDFHIELYDFKEKPKYAHERKNSMLDYHFSNDFYRNIDAMIYTCGYENCAPGHSYGPILRNGYLIHYVLHGAGIYKARGNLYRLKEGDAFLICPGELIYYEADRNTPWTYTWIGMQGIKVKGYVERTALPEHLIAHFGQDAQLRSCHENMAKADRLAKNRDLIMNSILYEYLFLLAQKFPNEQYIVEKDHTNHVEEALRYIEDHYCDPIAIQDIADHLGLNRSYLHRIFKSFTGVSIQSYLLDYRMRQACILLKTTSLSVRAVAHSVSYMDPLYFSRIFHKKMGVSPSEYRIVNSPQ